MESHDPQPDSAPEETSEESSENEIIPQPYSRSDRLSLSRRATLASVAGIGGLSLLSSPTAAKGTKTWKKDRDADGQELRNLGALTMQANPNPITSFDGTGLSIDGNGVLNATITDTRTNVSDDGVQVVPNVEDINFGSNLTVSDDMDNSATIDADTWDTDVNASGNSLTGADTIETDNFSLGNVGASASGSTTLSGGLVADPVEFSRVEFDHQNEFELEENRFTAADDGFYQVQIRVEVTDISPGEHAFLRRAVRRLDEDGDGFTTSFLTVDIDEVGGEFERDTFVSHSQLLQLDAGESVFPLIGKSEGGDNFYHAVMQVHQVG